LSTESSRYDRPKRRGWRRWLRIGSIAVFTSILASCAAVSLIATDAILHPRRKGVGAQVPEGMQARTFVMPDRAEIRTWEARPQERPKAAVFVLHGISDSKATQANTLKHLSRSGLLAIAPDLRAHGDSSGANATYGYLEKDDLSRLRRAVENEFPGLQVGLWGTSYGGAVALQALGADPDFDFAIIENTFADLRDISRQQVANHTSLPLTGLGPYFIDKAGKKAGFDPGQISPERSAEKIKVPVLHLHGDADEIIPIAHGRRIASHAKSGNYRFIPIKGGTHFQIQAGDASTYRREVDAFLKKVAEGS
jgi:alpha-beta hydrolase superfamily lysophospholipase